MILRLCRHARRISAPDCYRWGFRARFFSYCRSPTPGGGHFKNALPEVTLLKLDVEGHELTALRGAAEALQSHAIKAVYFEYFEKWLRRIQPPEHLLDFLESFGYAVYFCREANLQDYGGPTHTLLRGVPRHGIPLRPIERGKLPAMTDLIALPAQHGSAS